MNFVKEVIHEAAKRRGMSYDSLMSQIRRGWFNKGASAGLEGQQHEKEVNAVKKEQENSNETVKEEKVYTVSLEKEDVQSNQEPLHEQDVQKKIIEEIKTTGSIGNFGKQAKAAPIAGCNGERLGKLAVSCEKHPYFQ